MAFSSSPRWAYDVFVSFRGEDVRKNFMDHLFSDLRRKGIQPFKDDDHLRRGEEISTELYRAIEQSRFLMIIFSENYASSSWCLRELLKILECKERESDKYEVRAIFYNVKPAVVRNQIESYEVMRKHEASNRAEVSRWKDALTFAANLSGWDLQDTTNGYESKFIDIITKEIFHKLSDGPLPVDDNLVGLYARAEQMDLLRFVGSNKVRMIGIRGIGGIGKTTIAKAIYNILYIHFEGCSFLEDVKGVVKKSGLVHLHTQLLNDIMKLRDIKIQSVSEGIGIMKRRMGAKKVLLVLDDVDHYSQFEALAAQPNWFGPGSMIVVTSRDRQLLNAHGVEEIYEVDLLYDDEALELFSMYAFNHRHMKKEFVELGKRVVRYVKGLPLALKVLGRFLQGKNLEEWESELDKLRRCPNVDIQQVLRISYDGLDSYQRNIFLDIACFFKGEEKDYVMKILDACELFSATNLRVLVDKSLIQVVGNRIQMHDLIQQMGRQIVREESEKPGKRSRLWYPTDVRDVLNTYKGTESVKGLALDISSSRVNFCGKSFTKMTELRFLNLYCKSGNEVKVRTSSRGLDFLSNEIRLLCWHGYPFQYLPPTFYPESLVVLDLSYSCIKQLLHGSKGFRKLTVLKLKKCCNLAWTPDFTRIPNLEQLILEDCENLVGVHPSIGTLKRLVVLNLQNCRKLRSFPNVAELKSLKFLILSGCSSIDWLPEDIGKMKALVELRIDGTIIQHIPSSLFSLNNLGILSLGQCENAQTKSWCRLFSPSSFLRSHHPQALTFPTMPGLHALRYLNVSHCNLLGDSLDNIACLSSLNDLNLNGNDFARLPANFHRLSRLKCLRLNGCKKLQALPELPSSICFVYAQNCPSLEEVENQSTMHYSSFVRFNFRNCPKMVEKQSMENLVMTLLPQGRIDPYRWIDIVLPGSRIPGWFSNQSMGHCVKVKLPPCWSYEKFKGVALCAVVTPITSVTQAVYSSFKSVVTNFNGRLITDYPLLPTADPYPEPESDHVWLLYRKSDLNWNEARDHIMVSFKLSSTYWKVQQCGVRLVFEEDEHHAYGSRMIQWFPMATTGTNNSIG